MKVAEVKIGEKRLKERKNEMMKIEEKKVKIMRWNEDYRESS